MNHHIEDLLGHFPTLLECVGDIERAVELMTESYRSGGKLLVCGNGGSASDAEHITSELLKGFLSKRPLPTEIAEKMGPELTSLLQGALPAIPLTSFVALSTAYLNDIAGEATYAQLTYGLGRKGDVLLGLSTSGNARNVNLAMDVAHVIGMTTIGMTGAAGGCLGTKADVCIRVPASSTQFIQELHLPIYHCICAMLEETFFGD